MIRSRNPLPDISYEILILFILAGCHRKEQKLFTSLNHNQTGIEFNNSITDQFIEY